MSEIDDLMDLDPLDLSEQQLEAIIAVHRNARANFTDGIKTKVKAAPTGAKLDLGALGLVKKPDTPKPPSSGGMRRI